MPRENVKHYCYSIGSGHMLRRYWVARLSRDESFLYAGSEMPHCDRVFPVTGRSLPYPFHSIKVLSKSRAHRTDEALLRGGSCDMVSSFGLVANRWGRELV